MASNLYRIKRGTGSTELGNRLLGALDQLSDAFSVIERLRAAIVQEKDGSAGDDTDYVTPATLFGFVAADGTTISSAVAHAAFGELDSFYGNAGPVHHDEHDAGVASVDARCCLPSPTCPT